MTNDLKRAALIVQIIESIIDDPRGLDLTTTTLRGRINWAAKVGINDTGKLVGKQGAHSKAIQVLVKLMGLRFGEDWRFGVEEPDEGERAEGKAVEAVENYDYVPALQFLGIVLEAILDEAPHIEVKTLEGSFVFVVNAVSVQDYERLVEPVEIGRERLAPVAALGTLWRAYGKQQGASFRVEVPGRKIHSV